jgi:hypothetical protein
MYAYAESMEGRLRYKRHLQARVKQGKPSASELERVAHLIADAVGRVRGGNQPKPDRPGRMASQQGEKGR